MLPSGIISWVVPLEYWCELSLTSVSFSDCSWHSAAAAAASVRHINTTSRRQCDQLCRERVVGTGQQLSNSNNNSSAVTRFARSSVVHYFRCRVFRSVQCDAVFSSDLSAAGRCPPVDQRSAAGPSYSGRHDCGARPFVECQRQGQSRESKQWHFATVFIVNAVVVMLVNFFVRKNTRMRYFWHLWYVSGRATYVSVILPNFWSGVCTNLTKLKMCVIGRRRCVLFCLMKIFLCCFSAFVLISRNNAPTG